jgi:hypothetical protein
MFQPSSSASLKSPSELGRGSAPDRTVVVKKIVRFFKKERKRKIFVKKSYETAISDKEQFFCITRGLNSIFKNKFTQYFDSL